MKRFVLAACFTLSTGPALADEAPMTHHADGGIKIEAPLSALGIAADGRLRPEAAMAAQIDRVLDSDAEVDFSQGYVLPGPIRLTLTRGNGSVAFFDIAGSVIAFDAENTFLATGTNWTMRGVAVFEEPGGALRAEFGSMALISVD